MADSQCPRQVAEMEMKILSMNLSGRFSVRELKLYGQRALQYLLEKENVGLLFGHLAGFKLAPVENYEFVGTNRAFFLFNTDLLRGGDDKQFKQLVRNLQFRGKLSHSYAPENNYAVCKFRARRDPFLQFIAISWPSDESESRLKARNNFKHMIKFAADLAYLEQLPIVIGGTATTISAELVHNMPQGFEHFGYKHANVRRASRASEFFVLSTGGIRMTEVRPVICGKIDLNKASHTWKTPEDFFYYDPVKAVLWVEKIKSWGSSLSLLSSTATDVPADPTVRNIVAKIPRQGSYESHGEEEGEASSPTDGAFEEDGEEEEDQDGTDGDAAVMSFERRGSYVIETTASNENHVPEPFTLSCSDNDTSEIAEAEIQSQVALDAHCSQESDANFSDGIRITTETVKVKECRFEIQHFTLTDSAAPSQCSDDTEIADANQLAATSNGDIRRDEADDCDEFHYDWKSTAFCNVS